MSNRPSRLVLSAAAVTALLLTAAAAAWTVRRRSPSPTPRSSPARLHLVGAGPGDPELLTLAAVRALHGCDIVIADMLVSRVAIEKHVKSGTKVLIANKIKGDAHEAQMELQAWTLDYLQRGWDVVRLKGGDPFLYGRGGEEVEYFTKLGYYVECIPGISSSMAGPMSMGIPVTSRGYADQFMVATNHGKRDASPAIPKPYRENRTVVFLMSVSRLGLLCTELVAAGYPSDLPVAVVEKATCEDSRKLKSTIENFERDAAKFKLKSPAVIMVGGTACGAGLVGNGHWRVGGFVFDPVVLT